MTTSPAQRRRHPQRPLRTTAFFVAAILVAGVVATVQFAPSALIPRPPYWRWLVALLAMGVVAVVAEGAMELIWNDAGGVNESRDTAMRWGVLVAGLLLTILLLGAVVAVSWWLLRPLGLAAV